MAKTLGKIGKIAGIAAAVSSIALGPGNPVTLALTAVATVATVGSQVLAKPPPVRGSVAQLVIAADPPQPYMMGEGYYGGVLRHDAAYGATLNDVPNPYRGMVVVYSGGGPTQSITPQVDKANITAWYSTFLYTDTQLGALPEASAMAPNFAGLPGWDASSKLSGQAAILWNLKFDKKGKRFASGVPIIGAYGQWVKAYDPRLDSTFPGGSGAHRLGTESTYTWTENPALHFGTYAYGRYQNGKRTFGCGLTSIDWGVIAAWANVCDANAWTIFGVIYEPGNRWENLKDIAAAGGAVPVVSSGGKLSVKYWAPQVALDTITAADIAGGQVQYSPLQSWDDRVNTVIPRYTSADHEWNQVAADPVSIAGFVTEDGEEKRKEWPYNLVKDAEQAAQLAAYQIYEGREISPIVIPCLPRMRAYRPGECLTLDLPDYGLEMDAIILSRTLDPATLTVTLTLIGETPAKHAAALGQAPAPPEVPVSGQDGEDRDETSDGVNTNAPKVVADEAAMLLLVVPVGSLVKLASTGLVYYYNGGTAGTIADWTLIAKTAAITGADVTTALGYTPTSVTGLTGVKSVADFKTGLFTVTGAGSPSITLINSTDSAALRVNSDGSGNSYIVALNSALVAFRQLVLDGSTVILQVSGSNKVVVSATGAAVTGTLSATGNVTGANLSGTTIEVGHASDTTLSRVSAGVLAVEGVTISTASNALTLSNKTIVLGSNTLQGTRAEFQAANTDGDFVFTSDIGTTGAKIPLLNTSVTWSGNTSTFEATSNTTPRQILTELNTGAGAYEAQRLEVRGNTGSGRGPITTYYIPNGGGTSTLMGSFGGAFTLGFVWRDSAAATVATLTTAGVFDIIGSYRVDAVQVVTNRKTGWSVDTGTAKRTANATYATGATLTFSAGYVQAEHTATATRLAAVEAALQDATQTIKALKDDLHGTAGHGLIGT